MRTTTDNGKNGFDVIAYSTYRLFAASTILLRTFQTNCVNSQTITVAQSSQTTSAQ